MSSQPPVHLNESDVLQILSWDTLIPGVERVLSDITVEDETRSVIQPPRLIMAIPPKEGALLAMPGYCGNEGALGCKVVASYRKNVELGLPSVFGTILLLDQDTGKVKMIMEGNEITAWRTAASSVVATKYLHKGEKKVLAILGAGVEGRIHALAFRYYFKCSEIKVWNRTHERAEKLCTELGECATAYLDQEECVRGADVIVTATYSSTPLVYSEWLKPGAHINAVGFGVNHHNEVDLSVYKNATVVVDNMPGAIQELKLLIDLGIPLWCQLGEIIRNVRKLPTNKNFTVYHSMGMAVQDVIAASLVYKEYMNRQAKSVDSV